MTTATELLCQEYVALQERIKAHRDALLNSIPEYEETAAAWKREDDFISRNHFATPAQIAQIMSARGRRDRHQQKITLIMEDADKRTLDEIEALDAMLGVS